MAASVCETLTSWAADNQAIAAKRLHDGRIVALTPMLFGNIRLTVGGEHTYDHGY